MSVKQKRQSPAQRIANPVWLRSEIRKLIEDCANSIAEDQKLADQTYGDVRDRYLASIQSHRHWKRQLDRILRGKTANEDVSNFLQHEGVAQ